jgi:hypothetical protein
MNAKIPPPLTWHIYQIIIDYFGSIVSSCILNQSKGHWLLSDALNLIIFMSLKFKDKFDFATFDNLMEEDANVVYEFSCLASNVKRMLLEFSILFFFFSKI